MSINSVCISGNLTRDAEVRRTASGLAIVSFGMAVNDRVKNKQTGEWENYANYVDVTWFGAYAEKCAGSMAKGTKACVYGKLHYNSWERDGQKRSKLEVVAQEVELPPRAQGQQTQYQAPQAQYQEQYQAPQVPPMYEDDIPF